MCADRHMMAKAGEKVAAETSRGEAGVAAQGTSGMTIQSKQRGLRTRANDLKSYGLHAAAGRHGKEVFGSKPTPAMVRRTE
jgi:hypothetical protein